MIKNCIKLKSVLNPKNKLFRFLKTKKTEKKNSKFSKNEKSI